MIHAAGILFVAPQGRALFVKRAAGGDYAGFWCLPGGKQEDGESAEEAAKREVKEETGYKTTGNLLEWTRKICQPPIAPAPVSDEEEVPAPVMDPVDYITYLRRLPEEFTPVLDEENVGYAWAPIDSPPQPLHPGCNIALARFNMNELGVARAIRDGELVSPQFYCNMWLFAIRITGTGASYRSKLQEHVWRDSTIYLNDEFLTRINGLQVILEHPKGNVLNDKEFHNRTIGSVFLPFIPSPNFVAGKPDEVWAIAKIYDMRAVQLMLDNQLSTSPAVVFFKGTNEKVTLENGESLLVEGDPGLVDHIAICWNGVWDKGGDPEGVANDVRADDVVVGTPAIPDDRLDIAASKMRNIQLDQAQRLLGV